MTTPRCLFAFSPPFCRASFSGRLLRRDRAASQRVTGEEKLNFMPLIGERGWLPWKLIPLFSRQRCCLLIEDREKERLFIPDKKTLTFNSCPQPLQLRCACRCVKRSERERGRERQGVGRGVKAKKGRRDSGIEAGKFIESYQTCGYLAIVSA